VDTRQVVANSEYSWLHAPFATNMRQLVVCTRMHTESISVRAQAVTNVRVCVLLLLTLAAYAHRVCVLAHMTYVIGRLRVR
jgi:hypothetical protein